MKKILTTVCALALMLTGCTPALAAEAPAPQADQSRYYPISVEEYTYGPLDELRIDRVYQLSLSDDPKGIPTEDFVRGGRVYYLLDMVRNDEVGVDTQTHTETVTLSSDTNKMDTILQRLDAEMEFTSEDGYTGTLRLDHTSVQVSADGYASATTPLSAIRLYPNLSEAGILRNGNVFQAENVSVFEHDGLTNLLFPFKGVELEMGKLAMWRIGTHSQFGGTWLSDYVPNRLGGFTQEQVPQKPKMELLGQDGNIFGILGRASRLLKRAGQDEQANEMFSRVTACGDYHEALNIISEYVDTELSDHFQPQKSHHKKGKDAYER